jgi:hypothetical protein
VVKRPSEDGHGDEGRSPEDEKAGAKKGAPRPAVRITNQFRNGRGMVYDLSCEDVRLTLEVTGGAPGSPPEDADAEWRIEAFARHAPERPKVGATGPTRREALSRAASAWGAKRGAFGFPAVAWDAVADALVAVRAI